MRKVAIYLRVSTQDQTTANQERELRAVAERMGIEIAKVYRDHGISEAKGRDKRPDFDRLCKDAARRQFDIACGGKGARAQHRAEAGATLRAGKHDYSN
jgi:DNA invertase Pin-like site-specific DNA recombinase